MAKDPICRMTVDESSPLPAQRGGQTYFLCSEHCRRKFLQQDQSEMLIEPKDGPTKRDHSHHHHSASNVKPSPAAKYFCPMCPGVESNAPGDCPKCGMALERNPAFFTPAPGKVIYTCPMHPEVRQDRSADCPKCGMPLEPVTTAVASDDEENAELKDMTWRFWVSAALTLPVFVLAMAHLVPALAAHSWPDSHASRWIQLL